MTNLIFSLNATMPVFFIMILGFFFKKMGLLDDHFASKMNTFVFTTAFPALLFNDLSHTDFRIMWDLRFVLFCLCASLVSILISLGASFLQRDKTIRGEFTQAAYRSSPALLGVAFLQNIYGEPGAAPLMILGAVPLYNVAAVMVLALMKPNRQQSPKQLLWQTVKKVLTNPLIIGIAAGICWSLSGLTQPVIMQKTIASFATIATPLGLIVLGASFEVQKALEKARASIFCCTLKLLLFPALFLPLAIELGFQNDKLVAILIMLGAATTVSSFIMAKNMGHEGSFSANTVMLTTLASAFTLTAWLYLLKSLQLI